jgi:hypothetical protein
MSLRAHIDFEHLHHAYLIEGERSESLKELLCLLEQAGIVQKGNSDFHLRECDAFLLADAHEVKQAQSMQSGEGKKKIFIIAFHTMLSEAQNALLKTLEEPTQDTHFFFITRTGEALAETVRSRMFILQNHSEGDAPISDFGQTFLIGSIPTRLKMIERMTKAKTDDKQRAKEEARMFLESLERSLHTRLFGKDADSIALSLCDVVLAKRFLSDRSPSLKLLLEHLALTLPVCSKEEGLS